MKLQMLKRALIAYVSNLVKAIWSAVAHPLTIVGKKNCDVADYRIYGNSVQNGEPTPENPVELQSVGKYDEEVGKYKVPIMISTENLIDVSKASSTTTRYGERGIKQTRTAATNGGGRFPVSIKAGTTIYFSFKFVEAGGEALNSSLLRAYPADGGDRFAISQLYDLKEGKRYIKSYTATKDIKQVEFYTMAAWEVGSYYILDDVKLTTTEPQTVNIYLDEPLRTGQVMQKSKDNLPSLPQFEGTTVYEAQTEIPPSGMEIQYYG